MRSDARSRSAGCCEGPPAGGPYAEYLCAGGARHPRRALAGQCSLGDGMHALAHARQDVAAIGLEERTLALGGGVNVDLGEAEVEVPLDVARVDLRVGGDTGLLADGVGADDGAVLLGEGGRVDLLIVERGDVAAGPILEVVLDGGLFVLRILDAELDGARHLRGVLAGGASAFLEPRDDLLVRVRLLATDGDETIAVPAREDGAVGDHRGDVQRDRAVWPGEEPGLLSLVRGAAIGDVLARPERANELDGLAQAVLALHVAGPLPGGGVVIEGLAGTDREVRAAGGEHGDGGRGLRDNRGMVAQHRGRHAGAHADGAYACGDGAEPGPGEAALPGLAPRMEMVADVNTLEAGLLGSNCALEQVLRRELFGAGLPANLGLQHISLPPFGLFQ